MAGQAIMLNRVEEEMPSTSDVAKADDTELQGITENATRSIDNLIEQLEGESSEDLPRHGLLSLEKQLRSIRGSLKVGMAKKLSYNNALIEGNVSSRKSETIQNMTMAFEKTSGSASPS